VAARAEYWPSFVDVLTNLLLVFIFLLSIFALVQFLLSREISGRDTVLQRLNAQIAQLTEMLALEKAKSSDVTDSLATLSANLSAAESERDRLRGLLDNQAGASSAADARIAALDTGLENEKQISQRALSQVELLNQQIAALRNQIAALESALDVSEQKDKESQTQIADLGRRLNVALAQRVQELSRYRSDFFGRLRQILGDRPDIRIVGDRFVFQSEVLFATGSDEINDQGQVEMSKVASAISDLISQGDPRRHPLGPADQRPHRQAADQRRRALPVQLGAVGRPRHLGGRVLRLPEHSAGASGCRRLWRVPAAGRGRHAGHLRQEPPYRAEADRALSGVPTGAPGRPCPFAAARLYPRQHQRRPRAGAPGNPRLWP
jgi:chemotaxis protein MotB